MVSAIILGIVQGVTEFLPISSTGHLIIMRELLGLNLTGSLSFDAVLQLATACAVALYFWRDVWSVVSVRTPESNRLLVALCVGTIPAAAAGLALEDVLDSTFRSAHIVAWGLIGGALLMTGAEYVAKKKRESTAMLSNVNATTGVLVGFFQTLALVPGMSRSGSTIAGGLLAGFKREEAIRFSFLLSFPLLFGSGLKKLLDLGASGGVDAPLVVGSLVAFLVGLGAIHFLIVYLRKHTLTVFVTYRIILAILILAFI